MIYEKAILYQPVETKDYYYRELRLELYKDGKIQKQFQEKEKMFDVGDNYLTVYNEAPNCSTCPIERDGIKYKIPMSSILEFEKI